MFGFFNIVYFVILYIKWIIMLMEIYFKKLCELKDFIFCNKELLGGF